MKCKFILSVLLLALFAFAAANAQTVEVQDLNLNGNFEAAGWRLHTTVVENLIFIYGELVDQDAAPEDIGRERAAFVFQGAVASIQQQDVEGEEPAAAPDVQAVATGVYSFVPAFLDDQDQLEEWNENLNDKWGILTLNIASNDRIIVSQVTGQLPLALDAEIIRAGVELEEPVEEEPVVEEPIEEEPVVEEPIEEEPVVEEPVEEEPVVEEPVEEEGDVQVDVDEEGEQEDDGVDIDADADIDSEL